MRGKACGRWIDADGTKRYRALGTAEVLRWVKLVPSHLELQVRVLQLSVDLHSLAGIELGREFIGAWQGNMRKLVMDEECRALFCVMDLDELRIALYDAESPVLQLAHLRDHAEIETARSFKCSIPFSDRSPMSILFGHNERAHQP